MKHRLTVDAGNTYVKIALFEGPAFVRSWRFATHSDWPATAIATLPNLDLAAIGVAAVVPIRDTVVEMAEQFRITPFFVDARGNLPFRMEYDTPMTLGADRVAAAAAAWVAFGGDGRPVVSVDAGTAVTIEVVSGQGRFLGGSIAPGPPLQIRALTSGTAQLPEVDLEQVPQAIGTSTASGIRAGVLFGVVDAIDGMVRRICDDQGSTPHVVVTGGWAEYLSPLLRTPHLVDPHLVHRGILHLLLLDGDDSL